MKSINLRGLAINEEVDYNFLVNALSGYKNPRVKINDLIKKGDIIRVKKGFYVFGPRLSREPFSKETLANLIYGPSYISLEYALYFYGLIPEKVETVTSITNKRKKSFETPVGVFTYRYLNSSLYSLGITIYKINDRHSIVIAEREKAIADMLYFADKMKDISELEEHLSNNLRIDQEAIIKLKLNRSRKLAQAYGGNVKLFYDFLETIK